MTEQKAVALPQFNELFIRVSEKAGVHVELINDLVEKFTPFASDVMEALIAAQGVTDPSDKAHRHLAKQVRLKLKGARVAADKLRKQEKAASLATGRAVDGVAKVIMEHSRAAEALMTEVEDYELIQETNRLNVLEKSRHDTIAAHGGDPLAYNVRNLSDAEFDTLLNGVKVETQLRQKEEENKKALEAERAEEAKRLREDNARLLAEQEQQRLAEQARIDAEAVEKAEAERKAQEAAAEKRRADAAPDKEKLGAFIDALEAIVPMAVQTPDGMKCLSTVLDHRKTMIGKMRRSVSNYG